MYNMLGIEALVYGVVSLSLICLIHYVLRRSLHILHKVQNIKLLHRLNNFKRQYL